MRLAPLLEKWGVCFNSAVKYISLDEEGSRYVDIQRRGKRFIYQVKDVEGLKNFLKRHGFPIREGEKR
jgi:hypothetical protein